MTKHSKDFDFWSMAYPCGWCTDDDIRLLGEWGELTPEEVKEILGE